MAMTMEVQPPFKQSATGENTCPPALVDNIIWEGDLLAVKLAVESATGLNTVFVSHGAGWPLEDSYEFRAMPAVVSLSKAMKNPEETIQDLRDQIIKNSLLRGDNEEIATEAIVLVNRILNDFPEKYADRLFPSDNISDEQKSQLYTNFQKVPDVLVRAIDKDDVKVVIDDSKGLKGSVPPQMDGNQGVYLDGNIFISDPYSPDTMTQEMAHYVDTKLGFSQNPEYVSATKPLTNNPELLHVMGFILDRSYTKNSAFYETNDNSKMAKEFLADMYVVRAGLKSERISAPYARILDVNEEQIGNVSGKEALKGFYDRVVRGKTPEDIKSFYEARKPLSIDPLNPTDREGYALAMSMTKIPEQKMDEIFKNMDDPEGLLKALYPKEMIDQLDKFEIKMEEQYPKPQELIEPTITQPAFPHK